MGTWKPEIRSARDLRELSRMAAGVFSNLAADAVKAKGTFTVALSGGSTPKELYALLASDEAPFREKVPWENVHFFWGDERHVPPDHPESNYRMVHEVMLSKLPISLENAHPIEAENPEAGRAAIDYEEVLKNFFHLGPGKIPRFDLVLLGLGADGHTASLFPGSEVIFNRKDLVAATWVEKFDSYRITLTPPVLNGAAHVIFLVSGEEKAETVREVLQGEHQPDRFPAQIVRPSDGTLLWLVDQEAARLL